MERDPDRQQKALDSLAYEKLSFLENQKHTQNYISVLLLL